MRKKSLEYFYQKIFCNHFEDSQALNHPLFNWLHPTASSRDENHKTEKTTKMEKPQPPPVANKREQQMIKDIFGITVDVDDNTYYEKK